MSGNTGISRFSPLRCGNLAIGHAVGFGCTHPIACLAIATHKLCAKLSLILVNIQGESPIEKATRLYLGHFMWAAHISK